MGDKTTSNHACILWVSIHRCFPFMKKKRKKAPSREPQAVLVVVQKRERINNTKSTCPFAPPPYLSPLSCLPALFFFTSVPVVPPPYSPLLSNCTMRVCFFFYTSLLPFQKATTALFAATAAIPAAVAAATLPHSSLPPATSYTSPHTRAFPFLHSAFFSLLLNHTPTQTNNLSTASPTEDCCCPTLLSNICVVSHSSLPPSNTINSLL